MRSVKPMKHGRLAVLAPAISLVFALGACSADTDKSAAAPASGSKPVAQGSASPSTAGQAAAPAPAAASSTPAASAKVIGLEGLGDLRIGQPVPKGTSWAERGAQTGAECRTVSSPAYPGVYGMVVDGKVQRITVGKRSDVKLAEGIGTGATEKEVNQWFAGFRSEPHKYESAPAKYLTAPNAPNGSSALRFEIGQDGKVSFIHVGTMPVLAYVEGCA
ncbi:Uncharacterised protein [Bordetella ansorpii]|uniref:Lipoprotein n=1 Tax=Bordetella ansorpii TaxID=288768 RepID=A0A157Q632_9BORD|nr:hypothetical protein [Bordetella ansorpii]SAI41345.1 Uncharacterised protein [Bordetella ansorpii]